MYVCRPGNIKLSKVNGENSEVKHGITRTKSWKSHAQPCHNNFWGFLIDKVRLTEGTATLGEIPPQRDAKDLVPHL